MYEALLRRITLTTDGPGGIDQSLGGPIYMGNLTSFRPSMVALIVALGFGSGIAEAIHPIADEATPTLPERLTKDIVKGRLMMIEGEHVVIKVPADQEIKLQVDMNTKVGEVMIGDKVKAYVDDSGHVTTLQRDE